jgi:hypothetical protein
MQLRCLIKSRALGKKGRRAFERKYTPVKGPLNADDQSTR